MRLEKTIGKNLMGFKFDNQHPAGWDDSMNQYIAKKGIITNVNKENHTVLVKFDDGYAYWYPADGFAKKEIVDEEINIHDLVKQIQSL